MTPTDEARFIALWNARRESAEIGRQLGIPRGTVSSRAPPWCARAKFSRDLGAGRTRSSGPRHGGSPIGHPQTRPGTPEPPRYTAHCPYCSTLGYTGRLTPVHGRPLGYTIIAAHPDVPMPKDLAVRLLSLLPDLEVIVARDRDRQRLLGTSISTPRHTVKKTYVVDTLYADMIERYAKAEGVELKDVVNLAFHEFFERRQYLPEE